jgi:phage/conjugal plasmid C-4 type zinc finger TraR family protein
MDDCDLANQYATTLHETALANQLCKGKLLGESLEYCQDCGETIPEGRRKAVPGCVRCVTCETKFERKAR